MSGYVCPHAPFKKFFRGCVGTKEGEVERSIFFSHICTSGRGNLRGLGCGGISLGPGVGDSDSSTIRGPSLSIVFAPASGHGSTKK